MKLLTQLQFSINGIFDLYITQGRRFYGFSILFAILSSLWSAILGLVVVYIYFIIANMLDLNSMNFNKRFFDGDSIIYATGAAEFIMIINMSLYAIALNRFKREVTQRISFGTFFKCIDSSTWGLYFICTTAGVIIMNLLTDFATPSPNYAGGSMQQLRSLYEGPSATDLFFSFCVFILQFTPIVLGFFILCHLHWCHFNLNFCKQLYCSIDFYAFSGTTYSWYINIGDLRVSDWPVLSWTGRVLSSTLFFSRK